MHINLCQITFSHPLFFLYLGTRYGAHGLPQARQVLYPELQPQPSPVLKVFYWIWWICASGCFRSLWEEPHLAFFSLLFGPDAAGSNYAVGTTSFMKGSKTAH